jgi:glutamate-1-semialdehyde 2,1-aminomutase
MTENSGAALYRRAKQLIPGGTELLSKRPEMFLPEQWPAYYGRCKGAEVIDLDGNRYVDFAGMGVGACVLGYADDDVDAAVRAALEGGSMCSLNAPEEVELAERLVALHPWADMVRFSKTGGEACAIAVRIARAATGRSRVAFSGYHGWHDWYLAANLADSSALDGQLLPGLDPAGVPRELAGTALAFNYNRLDELEAIVRRTGGDIAAIVMEPMRATPAEPGFLAGAREIATSIGAALIVDEVTAGFRMNVGGLHLTMGVEPDIAVFAKAMGNGYPISAVIGRASFMDAAQTSFISSTMWTERTGFAAALATIAKIERLGVGERLTGAGQRLLAGWKALGESHGVGLHVCGMPPLPHIDFDGDQALACQTLYTQEMLDKGYLVGASAYMSWAHTDDVIDRFLADSGPAFAKIRAALDAGDVSSDLRGPVKHAGFARLT